jgi:hypothetical protein
LKKEPQWITDFWQYHDIQGYFLWETKRERRPVVAAHIRSVDDQGKPLECKLHLLELIIAAHRTDLVRGLMKCHKVLLDLGKPGYLTRAGHWIAIQDYFAPAILPDEKAQRLVELERLGVNQEKFDELRLWIRELRQRTLG